METYLESTTSIQFFEWLKPFHKNFRLEHLTKSNNLDLIDYAVEKLNWNLQEGKIYLTSSLPLQFDIHFTNPNYNIDSNVSQR